MQKRYPFSPKNWLLCGFFTVYAASLSFNLQAQTAPAKLWDKTIGGSSTNNFRCLWQTSDGGYILGGSSNSPIGGDKSQASKGVQDYWVVKLNANGNKTWDKTIGGSAQEGLYSLQQTSDGGYILGGSSNSPISGDKSQTSTGTSDYWVVKLDANGNKTWDKTIGGNYFDGLSSLQQTSDGGYILGGYSHSDISGDKTEANKGYDDYWVVKLDASGNKLWDKTYGGSDNDRLYSLQQTSDGGYILGGTSFSGISSDKSQVNKGVYDYWILKLDTNGNISWDQTFGGSDQDEFRSIQQTSDGGYILGGTSRSGISGDKTQAIQGFDDYWILKLDAGGNKLWDKTFGGSKGDFFSSLQQTSDGGYILGGASYSDISSDKSEASKGDLDYWIVKLNANGSKTWDKTIGGNDQDYFFALKQSPNGEYILGGYSTSPISGDKSQTFKGFLDYWVVKLGASTTGMKEAEAGFAVSISPNPNQGKFKLKLSNIPSSKAEVTITDLLGRIILQQELQLPDNQTSPEITLLNAKGIYLLQLKAGEQLLTRKIVVE